MKKIIFTFIFLFFLGCSANSKENIFNGLNFTVINYSTNTYANIRLDDQTTESLEGANYLGSYTNSGVYCCVDINIKNKLYVEYIIIDNKKELYKKKEVEVSKDYKGNKNLVLHILPNENFILEMTNNEPQPNQRILDNYLKKHKLTRKSLDEPLTWRLENE